MNNEQLKEFGSFLKSIPSERKFEMEQQILEQHHNEHGEFIKAYREDKCYLCNKDFSTYSKTSPCLHWLLRICKFKNKDYPLLTKKYDYHQILMYLRWVANTEYFQKNINDLKDEQSENKIFQITIRWKNIEWSFECSESDFNGHGGYINYPHYHFQMTINKNIFIKYNAFHNKFSEKDLAYLYAIKNDGFTPVYGAFGSGMQDAITVDPEKLLDTFSVIDKDKENDGAFHVQTMISNQNGIDMEIISDIMEESRRTKKSFAKLLRERLTEDTEVISIITPSDRVPEMAKRTEHKPRKS